MLCAFFNASSRVALSFLDNLLMLSVGSRASLSIQQARGFLASLRRFHWCQFYEFGL